MPPRKFSTLIKQMIVELDRDMHLYPEGNIVEVSYGHPMGVPMILTRYFLVDASTQPASARWLHHSTKRGHSHKDSRLTAPRTATRAVQSASRTCKPIRCQRRQPSGSRPSTLELHQGTGSTRQSRPSHGPRGRTSPPGIPAFHDYSPGSDTK